MSEKSDRALVHDTIRGDRYAFDQLVERHQGSVYAVAYAALLNEEDAKDVCQETFVRVYERLNSLRQPEQFVGYATRAAYRLALNRAQRPEREMFTDDATMERLAEPLPVEQEQAALHWDRNRLIETALRALTAELRVAVALRFMADCSYRDIAERLSITPSAAQDRVRRALAKMRERLERLGLARAAQDLFDARWIALPVGLDVVAGVREATARLPASKTQPGVAAARRTLACVGIGGVASLALLTGFYASLRVPDASGSARLALFDQVNVVRPAPARPVIRATPPARTLIRPGEELVGWMPWKPNEPALPVWQTTDFRSPPRGAAFSTDAGVWRELGPAYGAVTVRMWIKPTTKSASVAIHLMIDGERSWTDTAAVQNDPDAGWWAYGNPNAEEHRAPDARPNWDIELWVHFAPIQPDGQELRIVHRTDEGTYDVCVDGKWGVKGISAPRTRGKPVTGIWMRSGFTKHPQATFFDDLSVTVEEEPRI